MYFWIRVVCPQLKIEGLHHASQSKLESCHCQFPLRWILQKEGQHGKIPLTHSRAQDLGFLSPLPCLTCSLCGPVVIRWLMYQCYIHHDERIFYHVQCEHSRQKFIDAPKLREHIHSKHLNGKRLQKWNLFRIFPSHLLNLLLCVG